MININGKEFNKLRLKDIEKYLSDVEDNERFFLEFKEEDIRPTQLSKEVAAFANSYGGYFLLGVTDDKKIVGCSNNWSELRINTIICNGISPTPNIDIKNFKINESKRLYIIKIEEGLYPPYITNEGYLYHRVGSSSDRIKDSYTLNNLYIKSKDNIKKIEEKIYIDAIDKNVDNLCAYLDLGFSIQTKNFNRIYDRIENADINKISEYLKTKNEKYSISRTGYSISITIGIPEMTRGSEKILTNAGLANFMEILPDGSFRCRVIITAEKNSSIASISSITLIYSVFKDIYEMVLGDTLHSEFIEAKKYEKLTVLKLFQPKIVVNQDDDFKTKFDKHFENHLKKYGNNIILNNNRVPMTGFGTINKKMFSDYKLKYNNQELLKQLFYTSYNLLGYFDSLPNDDEI